MKYNSTYFGLIDFENPQEWYEIEMELNNRKITVSITILSKNSVNKGAIERIDNYLSDFEKNEQFIRKIIFQNYIEQGETKNYVGFIKEDLATSEIASLTKANINLSDDEKIVQQLYLHQIVFYPEKGDTMFSVFDYTIDEELTDNLLVVKYYKNENIKITIES